MNLIVTTPTCQLDLTQWEIALNLLTVMPLDTRRWIPQQPNGTFYNTPDDYLRRGTRWDHATQTFILEPHYSFRIQVQISGSIYGWINYERDADLSLVKDGIASALANPLTIANTRRWDLDTARRRACNRGDEEHEARLLKEQRDLARVAFTYYDPLDQARIHRRHTAL